MSGCYRVRGSVLRLVHLVCLIAGFAVIPHLGVAQENARPLQELARELLEGSRDQRREAAYQLSKMGPEAAGAVDALIKALDDRDRQVWFYSIDAIANIGEPAAPAIPKLISDLGTEDRQRWYRTAYALARIGEPAFDAIVRALEDRDTERRAGAALALSFRPELARRAVAQLAKLLGDPSEFVRHQVVLAFEATGAEGVVTLKQALTADDPVRVRTALQALARVRPDDREVQETVVRLASESDDAGVRAEALRTMAELRPPLSEGVKGAILAALQHDDREVRLSAMDVVIAYGPDAADLVPAIAALTTEAEGERAVELAELFERLGPVAAAAAEHLVLAYVQAGDEETRATLRRTLAALGAAVAPAVRKTIESRGEAAAVAVPLLADLGDAGVKELLALAKASNEGLRVAALRALAEADEVPPEASDVLVEAARANDERVRAAALLAAARHARSLAVDRDELVRSAEELSRASHPEVQEAGVYALVVLLDDQRATGLASAVLANGGVAARRAVLRALMQRERLDPGLAGKAAALLRRDCPADLALEVLEFLDRFQPAELKSSGDAIRQVAAGHADARVRLRAAQLAGKLAAAGVYSVDQVVDLARELARDGEDEIRLQAVELLEKAGPERAGADVKELVLALMRDDRSEVRVAALRLCPKVFERSEAVRALAVALEREPEWGVRREIFQLLAEMGEDAVPAVPAILRRLRVRDDEDDALRALRRIRRAPKEAEPLVIELLRSRSRSHRLTAAVLLGTIDPPPSDRSLIPLLRRILTEDAADIPFLREPIERTINRIESAP